MRSISNFLGVILLLSFSASSVFSQTEEGVIGLVKQTRAAIEQDAEQTLESINFSDHPYKDQDNTSLYVFILDTDLTVAAHPVMSHIVGENLKGRPDSKGKMFREEMLEKALSDGHGWVDYYYFDPKIKREALKNSYFELANGSDGKKYIVGSGRYLGE